MDEFERLSKELGEFIKIKNQQSDPEMDNLSPTDMFQILYHTFDETSPIQILDIISNEELVEGVPFLKLLLCYLGVINSENEIKLTSKGNLPRKLCFELYDLGIIKEDPIETGITKLNKEGDSLTLQNIKIISQLSGLTKKRVGKVTLTSKGKSILTSPMKVFEIIFPVYAQKFNWGYHDGYQDNGSVQSTFGFLLYLLIQYGGEEKSTKFYSQKHSKAFPMIFDEVVSFQNYGTPENYYDNLLRVRLFERFLEWFGFVNVRMDGMKYKDESCFIKTTEVFQKLFTIDNSKFKFSKPNSFA